MTFLPLARSPTPLALLRALALPTHPRIKTRNNHLFLGNPSREAVKKGNKVFGAAILKLSDLSLVAVGTNTEIECPLWHGEVSKKEAHVDERAGMGRRQDT